MIAVKRLQSIFWVLLVTLGAIAVYLISLRVATERTELARVEARILSEKRDIRYLETEFSARASLRQLERWNAEDFRFSTPTATQYLDGEKALASLDRLAPSGPLYKAAPVMTAMADTPADLPSAAAPNPGAAEAQDKSGGQGQSAAAKMPAAVPSSPRVVKTAEAAPAPAAKVTAKAVPALSAARHAQRLAMLEQKLLDDHTLGDIARLAARERGGVMR